MMQIAIAQQKHKEAKEAHSYAVADKRKHLEKIERQQALAKIGGTSEQATLQHLQAEQELLVKNTEFTQQNLEEAEKLLDAIPAIVEDLEKIKTECNQLEHEQSMMESIQSDVFDSWGEGEKRAI